VASVELCLADGCTSVRFVRTPIGGQAILVLRGWQPVNLVRRSLPGDRTVLACRVTAAYGLAGVGLMLVAPHALYALWHSPSLEEYRRPPLGQPCLADQM
jgi:hypothetical protein